jgi:hypothetical protein
MVASFNKWFIPALFPFILMIGEKNEALKVGKAVRLETLHPFHVSVVEVEHNASEKTLEISVKIFTDDFETILAKNYNAKVDLTNPPNKPAMDSLVKKYIYSHLSLKANGRPVSFVYVGYEIDKEAAYGYIEVDNIPSVSKIDINNTLLYDKFDDEVNIMHVKVNGERKSNKLTYPDKEVSFAF